MDNDLIQDTNLDLLQVNAVEVEYSGIAPINVDNQEHTISLDPSALSSKLDTSAFDEWTATHSAGEEYSAGEGIDITDHVISYTGDPGDATPWISGNKIITSADYMQPGEFIQVLSSFDLSGNKNHFITVKGQGYYFPTNQQLKERVGVDDYLPLSSFSSYTASIASNLENNWNYTNSAYSQSLNNYYNKLDISAFSSWSSEHSGDYLTKESADTLYQPIGDYLTTADSGNFYPMEGNPSGFLTGVDLSNYYEKNETSSKEEISDAITSVENIINNLTGEYYPLNSNPSGYLTAHQDISDKLDVTAFTAYTATAKGTEYSAGDNIDITNHVISGKDWTSTIESATSGKLDTTAFNSGDFYPMTGNPSGFITDVDLTNYYEKNETSSKEEISAAFEALSGIDDPYELSAGDGISIVNDNTAKKTIINSTGISSKLDTSAFTAYTATAIQGFEYTGIAPIDVNNTTHEISADVWTLSGTSGIEILEDAENKVTTIANTAQPDLSNYYTKTDIQSQSANYYPITGNPSGFITGQYLPLTAVDAAVGDQPTLSVNNTGFAHGLYASAHYHSFVQGINVSANINSFAQGNSATANDCSFAQGFEITSRNDSFAQGHIAYANEDSFAQGYKVSAEARSFVHGNNTSAIYDSIALGKGLLANNYTMAVGRFNKTSANTPFVIGNGTSTAKRSDLFIINSSGGVSAAGKISANGVELGAGGGGETIDLSAGEGISIVEAADKVLISNNISAGSNMSFVYDSETNKIRIDGANAFPITATDSNTTWSADCKASAFTMARNTSRTDIGAYGFEYRQAPSVDVSGTWYDLAILMEKFKYAIPVEAVANSGMATGQNILYVVTGN